MLKRECHYVVNALVGNRCSASSDGFTDDHFDAAKIIRRAPEVLLEKLVTKIGKRQQP